MASHRRITWGFLAFVALYIVGIIVVAWFFAWWALVPAFLLACLLAVTFQDAPIVRDIQARRIDRSDQ